MYGGCNAAIAPYDERPAVTHSFQGKGGATLLEEELLRFLKEGFVQR